MQKEEAVTRVVIQGHVLEVSTEAAVTWATATIVSPLDIVATAHWALSYAMPGRAIGDYLRLVQDVVKQLQDEQAILDEGHFIQAINGALPPLAAFGEAGLAIRAWQLRHVPRRVRAAHNRAIRQHGPVDPPWRYEEGFATRLHNLSAAFSRYLGALAHIIPTLQGMLPSDTSPSLSEQLDRTQKQLPDFHGILSLGYPEMARWKAAEMGYLPSA